MKYELRPYQKEASDKAVEFFLSDTKENVIEVLSTGCHARGYEILMYDGSFKKVEDIVVGDLIMGDNATPRKVLRLERGKDEMYKITPLNGEPFVVNGGHILHLYKSRSGFSKSQRSGYDEISVRDYIKASVSFKHRHKLHRTFGIDFPEKDTYLTPYFVGLLLGDGYINNGLSITTMRDEVTDYIYDYAYKMGWNIRKTYKVRDDGSVSKAHSLFISASHGVLGKRTPLRSELDRLGIYGKTAAYKFIPDCYKFNSYDRRLELLAGLLDTDSYYDIRRNGFEYCTKSERLAKDIQFLSRSV